MLPIVGVVIAGAVEVSGAKPRLKFPRRLEAALDSDGSRTLIQSTPIAELPSTPEKKICRAPSRVYRLQVIAAQARNADIVVVCRARRRGTVVRLQDRPAIVITKCKNAPFPWRLLADRTRKCAI